MATNFPNSVDSLTNPTTSDTLASVSHSAQHTDANDAIEAIQTALLDGAPLHIDDANNRVGIGTTSPAQKLHVAGSSPRIRVTADENTNAELELQETNGVTWSMYNNNSNGSLTYYSSATGNVADLSSSGSLSVLGDINAQGYARSKGKKLGMALIYEGSLSGTTSTFLGTFSADWLNYRIVIDAAQNGNGGWTFFRFVDSTNNSIQSGYYTGFFLNGSYNTQAGQGGAVAIYSEYYAYGGMIMDITLPYQGDHPSFHLSSAGHNVNGNAIHSLFANGYCATTSDITGFQFYNGAPYGAVKVYGY